MRCMELKMSSCITWMVSPMPSPMAVSASTNSWNGMEHLEMSTIIIMANRSCRTDWVTSTTLTLCSAQMEETRARMPTMSFPITVMTARINNNLPIIFFGIQPKRPKRLSESAQMQSGMHKILVLIMNGNESYVKKRERPFPWKSARCYS